jgi:uridylate kinase
VDGVYDADPKRTPGASRYVTLSSDDAIRQDLRAMDQSALILARDHGLPIHLFDFDEPGAALRVCRGENIGTLIAFDATTTVA